jgi:ribosomal protein S16
MKMKRRWAKARKRRHVPGQMNRLEKKMADRLEAMKVAGEILWWEFEPIRLRLTIDDKRTTYTPDFIVLRDDLETEVIETKGYWKPAARVKTKVAADKYWFWHFRGAMWSKKDGWAFEEFSKEDDSA